MNRTMKSIIFATTLVIAVMAGAVPSVAEDVEKVFKFYCAQCHGESGDGKGINVTEDFPVTPRAFNNAAEMNKLTDADLRNVIHEGGPIASKSEMMPPWGKTLSDEDIDNLVIKLRALCQCKGKQG
ncbi:MAG: cytochrome c [Rhodospirillaceae bacterium]|nr:cytochrome c [Rhodospirillaceae bacterium]MBL6940931.1 cytochrome c [Rhodospirillales bacterium]